MFGPLFKEKIEQQQRQHQRRTNNSHTVVAPRYIKADKIPLS